MEEIFKKISECIEFGKINKASSYPPKMKGLDGADELTIQALDAGANAQDILQKALIVGMAKVGVKFRENKVFVPQVLLSAKAMSAAMVHLKPYFQSGQLTRKGVFIIGTVKGDLHDIGKNLVAMMVEGNGYEVIDLGVDVDEFKFIEEARKYPKAVIGMSALLTTTMVNMESMVKAIKNEMPERKICVGGAPVTLDFCKKINADSYSSDPQGVVDYLDSISA